MPADSKTVLAPDDRNTALARLASRFPDAFTILFALIIIVAALTWILPAGQYDRVMNEAVGREVAVPGTFQEVNAEPQGLVDVLMAPVAVFYNPESYEANAIDVALFALVIGGFLGVVPDNSVRDNPSTAKRCT